MKKLLVFFLSIALLVLPLAQGIKAEEPKEENKNEVKEENKEEKKEEKTEEEKIVDKIEEKIEEKIDEKIDEVLPKEEVVAVVSDVPFELDAVDVKVPAYLINQEHYFKIRDVAYLLTGTGSRFNIAWNKELNTVELTKGEKYVPLETDLKDLPAGEQKGIYSPVKFVLDGKEIAMHAYLINQNNFIKLRDLAEYLDFKVDWDNVQKKVIMKSKIEENEEEVKDENKEENKEEKKDEVKDKKEEVKVIVYGKETCGACIEVKKFLDGLKIKYDYRDISDEKNHEEFKKFNYSYVPVIVVDGTVVKGANEEELTKVLKEKGLIK